MTEEISPPRLPPNTSHRDSDLFINEIDYNVELFDFIKTRVDPNATRVPKRSRLVTSSRLRQFYIDKKKASIIICPDSKCREYCIETEGSALVDQFVEHVKNVHDLTPKQEFVQKLSNTISYIRSNKAIRYTDPYMHVDYENLLQNLDQDREVVR